MIAGRLAILTSMMLVSCGDASEHFCTPGKSLSCTCPAGRPGTQVCRDDGKWSTCTCTPTTVDAGPDAASATIRFGRSEDHEVEGRIDAAQVFRIAGHDRGAVPVR